RGGALFYHPETTFSNLENLDLRCNPGGSYVEVAGVNQVMNVSIRGGAGANTFDITPASSDLDRNVLGSLPLFGDGGTDKVSLFDHNDILNDVYNIGANFVSKSGV